MYRLQLHQTAEMRLRERLRFALKDLRKRRLTMFFNLTAVVVAVVYLLVPAFYGMSFYRYQRSVLDESLPTLVVATSPDVTDEDRRFTRRRIDEIAAMPEVALAFPKIELGVKLSLEGKPSVDVPLEGTLPADPGLSPPRLAWGRPVSSNAAEEIVLPLSLFNKLGGGIGRSGPRPASILVTVGRTVGGHEQRQTLSLNVVGILARGTDKAYAPLSLVERLDLWCSNKVNGLADDGRSPSPPCPRVFVYVPIEHRAAVAEEAKHLRIRMTFHRAIFIFDGPGAAWPFLLPCTTRVLLKYSVQDLQHNDGHVNGDLLRVMRLTKPTFAAVVPDLAVRAELANPFLVNATLPDDPARHDAGVLHGDWLHGASSHEIVLPAHIAADAFPGRVPRDCVGRTVEVRFRRAARVAASEPALTLPLNVVGITAGETAFAPLPLLQQLALWKDGRVIFNEARQTFEAPAAIYARRGSVRCNVHAKDVNAVAPLVAKLRRMGFQTEDSLADQQGLRKLGQALAFVVGAFALGCLVISGAMIVVTTMMNVQAKQWEIGILKAHGMKTTTILSIFAIQGTVIGTAAFLAGAALVAVCEPLLRGWLASAFHLPMETIVPDSLWSSPWTPALLLLSLAVALVLTVAGVTIPALRAARMLPVDLLKRKE